MNRFLLAVVLSLTMFSAQADTKDKDILPYLKEALDLDQIVYKNLQFKDKKANWVDSAASYTVEGINYILDNDNELYWGEISFTAINGSETSEVNCFAEIIFLGSENQKKFKFSYDTFISSCDSTNEKAFTLDDVVYGGRHRFISYRNWNPVH